MSRLQDDSFHVAIVGAGIAGLALAIGLQKKGVSFTLYEEATQYSTIGAGIGFGPNGLRAMDLIEPEFRSRYEEICVGNKPNDAQHVFFEGLLLKEGLGQEEPWYGNSAWGHSDFIRKSAHRKALLDVMTSFISIESVKFNKRLTDIEQHPDKVLLHFSDGEIAYANVLAGADGIASTVREHVLGPLYPEQVASVYAGSYCYRGVIPIHEAEDILGELTDVARFYFGYKRSAVTYRISGGQEFNFLLCAVGEGPWTSAEAITERVLPDAMMADFDGPGVDQRFRQLLTKASPIRWGLFHHPNTSTYHRERVVMLGDSAHASLPFQAAGAAQGVEDALILSNVLAEASHSCTGKEDLLGIIQAALDAYDSVRRPRAQKQLEQSAEVSRMIFFQHEEAGSDMQRILPMLQNDRFNWLWFHDIEEDIRTAISKTNKVVNA